MYCFPELCIFAENLKIMYILVNKRPFKVFDLKISDIHQMDIQTVQRMVKVGKGVIRLYNSDLTGHQLTRLKASRLG